ncbi:unnamed protein product [Closterium sp. NIES-53]
MGDWRSRLAGLPEIVASGLLLQQCETEEEEEQGRPHTPFTPILATPKPQHRAGPQQGRQQGRAATGAAARQGHDEDGDRAATEQGRAGQGRDRAGAGRQGRVGPRRRREGPTRSPPGRRDGRQKGRRAAPLRSRSPRAPRRATGKGEGGGCAGPRCAATGDGKGGGGGAQAPGAPR